LTLAAPPLAPGCPLPAVALTRVNVAFAPLTKTAMLDAASVLVLAGAVEGALCAVKAKSSKTTPVVVPVTCNASPAADGVTCVGVAALYVHDAQLKPP
jgi:hypothetical protein